MTDSDERWSSRTRLLSIVGASALPWLVILAPFLILTTCAQYPCAGGNCPSECRRDLSGLDARIINVDREWMDAEISRRRPDHAGPEHAGHVLAFLDVPTQTIYIDQTLPPEKYEAALQHERCHILKRRWHA